MSADHSLGPVVNDRHRRPAEVRECPAVAVEERLQVLAGGEAAERIPRVRERHVEGVDLRDAHVGEDLALISPVHLRLGPWDHLEPAVHPRQFLGRDPEFVGDPRRLNVELDPTIVPGEAVLLGQSLVDDRGLHQDLGPEHRIDQRSELVDHPCPRPPARRSPRRGCRPRCGEVLADRLAVQTGLPGDLRQAHRPGLQQAAKAPKLQPSLRIQDHCQPPPPPVSPQQQRAEQQVPPHQQLSLFIRTRLGTFTCTPTPGLRRRPALTAAAVMPASDGAPAT